MARNHWNMCQMEKALLGWTLGALPATLTPPPPPPPPPTPSPRTSSCLNCPCPHCPSRRRRRKKKAPVEPTETLEIYEERIIENSEEDDFEEEFLEDIKLELLVEEEVDTSEVELIKIIPKKPEKSNSPQKSFKCSKSTCTFETAKKSNLTRHHKTVHNRNTCTKCGRKCSDTYPLKMHMQLEHVKHTCSDCLKTFYNSRLLKQHRVQRHYYGHR